MKQSRTAVISGLVLLIFVVLAFVFWPNQQNSVSISDDVSKVNFRLKWLWYSGWAGELLAEDQGQWKDAQLDVNTQPGGFEIDPIKLVAARTDHIGIAGADQILFARENGVPLVAFAVQYQQSPVGFVSMKSLGIKNINDFKGRKIGVKYGTDVEPIYRALLGRIGFTKDDVVEVPVKFDLAPFFFGTIDVYPGYLTNDLLIPEEKGYNVNIISAPELGVTVYGNVYFCREDYIRQHSDILVKFLRIMRDSWIRALSMDAGEIAALALKKNEGLNLEHELRVVKSLKPFILGNPEKQFGTMTNDGWERLYSLLREQGVLSREFDYRLAYTLDILKRLADEQN